MHCGILIPFLFFVKAARFFCLIIFEFILHNAFIKSLPSTFSYLHRYSIVTLPTRLSSFVTPSLLPLLFPLFSSSSFHLHSFNSSSNPRPSIFISYSTYSLYYFNPLLSPLGMCCDSYVGCSIIYLREQLLERTDMCCEDESTSSYHRSQMLHRTDFR